MLKQLLIAMDQVLNALLGGMADETLSARAHRQRLRGHPAMARAINALFFWQADHCAGAYASEQQRRHLPGHYQHDQPPNL